MISAISRINPVTQDDTFLDIGCSVGNVLAQIALATDIGASIKIETRPELVNQGQKPIASQALRWELLAKLRLFATDVRQLVEPSITPFASATIFFANNVRFEPTVNSHIYHELFLILKAWTVVLQARCVHVIKLPALRILLPVGAETSSNGFRTLEKSS